MQTESFTIGARKGVCEILTMSHLPTEKLTGLFNFAFSSYAPIALLSENVAPGAGYAYLVAAIPHELDLCRLLEVLGRNEEGWQLCDGVIRSPRPSKLDSEIVVEAIAASRTLVEAG